jgi:hypothetical protein
MKSLLSIVLLVAALVTATLILRHAKPLAAQINTALKVSKPADRTSADGLIKRPLRYSVVAGGVHSVEQLRRAYDSDPEYRNLIGDVDWSKMHQAYLANASCFFSSFRKTSFDLIRWTAGPSLCLPAGEEIFTDGEVLIKAACGNRVSLGKHYPIDPSVFGPELNELEPPPISQPVTLALWSEPQTLPPSRKQQQPPTVIPPTFVGGCCGGGGFAPPSTPTVQVGEPPVLVMLLTALAAGSLVRGFRFLVEG